VKNVIIAIIVPFLTIILCSFSYQNLSLREAPVNNNIDFVAFDRNSGEKLQNVKLIVINNDGKIIDILATDKNGKAEKKISAPIDRRYFVPNSYESVKRGTVTVVAYKDGYCETVLFEVPVSINDTYQPFSMDPVVSGQRNEPVVQIGTNHHLEIASLVEKYRQYLNIK